MKAKRSTVTAALPLSCLRIWAFAVYGSINRPRRYNRLRLVTYSHSHLHWSPGVSGTLSLATILAVHTTELELVTAAEAV